VLTFTRGLPALCSLKHNTTPRLGEARTGRKALTRPQILRKAYHDD
jgi:hypothetical protein